MAARAPLWRDAGLARRSADRLARQQCSITARLKALLPDDGTERVAAAFIRGGEILAARSLAEGTQAIVTLELRRIIHAALHHDADEMVIGHNHPSGNVRPSRADVETTHRLRVIAGSIGINLHDHIIFAGKRLFSMKEGRFKCIGKI